MPAVTPLVPDEQPSPRMRASPAAGQTAGSAAGEPPRAPDQDKRVPDAVDSVSGRVAGQLRGPGSSPDPIRLLRQGARSGRLTHVEHIPARTGRSADWPGWVPAELAAAFAAAGVLAPWTHQAAAAEHARAGRNVIISTPAASGKSVGYLLPALTGVLAGRAVLGPVARQLPAHHARHAAPLAAAQACLVGRLSAAAAVRHRR